MRAADLKQNDHIFLQGRPCKVEEIAGRETVHVTGHDIFTGRRHEGEFPSTQDVEAFNIIRKEYELVNINDGMLNLMTRDGVEKDMMVPRGDLGKIIEDGFNTGQDLTITVISVGDEEAVVGCR